MLDLTTVVIFVVILLLGYWFLKKGPSNLPPGPGLRYLLKIMFIKTKPEEMVLGLWRQFGDIVAINGVGSFKMIFLFSHDMFKEALIKNADSTSNRPNNLWLFNKLSKKKGILFNPTTWKSTRKFALHSMRDFGLGRHSLDERIQDESRVLVKLFRDKSETAFDPQFYLTNTVSNIICSITFGKRYSHDDEEFHDVLEKLDAYFKCGFNESVLNNMPFLRHFSFLSNKFSVEYYMRHLNPTKEFILREISRHRATYDADNMRDLVDLYIQAEKNDFQDLQGMDEEQLFQTILDIFVAGTETTTNTLRWLLMYLINHLDVQKKCQAEIHKVVGRDSLPEYRDRNNFPYIIATIQEAIRLKTVALGTLPHTTDQTMELGGYTIPKGYLLMGITMGLMYDPKIWGDDVEEFRPDRWLDDDGQVRSVPEFIPFGIGRRACPGEQLARAELFVNTVALLQNFTFKAEDPEHPPKVEGTAGLTYVPHPFKIVPVPVVGTQ